MGIIAWLLVGGIAGWLASMIMKTNDSQGMIMNIVVGIVGAVIGGWLMSWFGGYGVTGFNLQSILVATLGAVVLLAVLKLLKK